MTIWSLLFRLERHSTFTTNHDKMLTHLIPHCHVLEVMELARVIVDVTAHKIGHQEAIHEHHYGNDAGRQHEHLDAVPHRLDKQTADLTLSERRVNTFILVLQRWC